MSPSQSRARVSGKSTVVAVFLLLVSSGSAQQLTIREIAFLRDSGLMRPEDLSAAYDHHLDNEKTQLYRSAVKKLMDGEERKTVEAFLNMMDTNAQQAEEKNVTSLLGGACPLDACKNMAICIPADRGSDRAFTCLCPDGYFGELCQYDVIDCVRQPCLHDGDCRKDAESEKGYKCVCAVGFTGEHCELVVSVSEAKTTTEDLSGDPIFLSYVALCCLLVLMCGLSLVISVEAERKLMYARYKLYTAVGYAVPFPRLEFGRMVTRACRRCLCCLGWCIPDDDDDYPEIPGSAAEPSGKVISNVAKP